MVVTLSRASIRRVLSATSAAVAGRSFPPGASKTSRAPPRLWTCRLPSPRVIASPRPRQSHLLGALRQAGFHQLGRQDQAVIMLPCAVVEEQRPPFGVVDQDARLGQDAAGRAWWMFSISRSLSRTSCIFLLFSYHVTLSCRRQRKVPVAISLIELNIRQIDGRLVQTEDLQTVIRGGEVKPARR